MSKIVSGDWVTVKGFGTVGFVLRVATDGSWCDVDWRTHTKRMKSQVLHIETTITVGDCEMTDVTRKEELAQDLKGD